MWSRKFILYIPLFNTQILDSQTCSYRWKSAGNVFFLARSPEAPSTTMESDPVSAAFSESLDKGDSVPELFLLSKCHLLDAILYQQHQTNITLSLASNKQVANNQISFN